MLAALLLAAAAIASPPLAVWPTETGPAMTVVDEVEFYVTEPESRLLILLLSRRFQGRSRRATRRR